jgi:hypothetical protein
MEAYDIYIFIYLFGFVEFQLEKSNDNLQRKTLLMDNEKKVNALKKLLEKKEHELSDLNKSLVVSWPSHNLRS